jgi:hypothetical protein
MTFYFDEETGVMRIAFENEAGPCVYVETALGIFRIERDTNKLVSIAIPAFYEKVADGSLSLPNLSSTTLSVDVIRQLQTSR